MHLIDQLLHLKLELSQSVYTSLLKCMSCDFGYYQRGILQILHALKLKPGLNALVEEWRSLPVLRLPASLLAIDDLMMPRLELGENPVLKCLWLAHR